MGVFESAGLGLSAHLAPGGGVLLLEHAVGTGDGVMAGPDLPPRPIARTMARVKSVTTTTMARDILRQSRQFILHSVSRG